MDKSTKKSMGRQRRKIRGRKKINGTAARPRLCVFRSNKSWYAQVIDDDAAKTVAAATSKQVDGLTNTSNKEAAAAVGKLIAEKAKAAGVETVVFDKNGFLYHGRVAALADAAREAGLVF